MKRFLKRLGYIFLIPLVVITILLFPVYESEAATLSAAYLVLSRMKAGLTSTANLEIYIAFETSGAVSADSTLTLEFPDGDDTNWCRTAGSDLTVAGVTSTPGDSSGAFTVDSALPAQTALVASCSQGTGASSADTLTITDLDGLTAGITYGVKVSNGTTAKLGTSSAGQKVVTLTVDDGSDPETKSFGINIVSDDEVDITATVVDVQTVTCSLSTNSVNLGNLYKGGSYVTGTHTITTSTSSSAGGYYWCAYGLGDGSTDAGLYKSTATTYLIDSTGSTTIDLSVPGSEGFGMTASQPTGATVSADFSDASAGTFGALDLGASGAQLFLYQIGAQATSEDSTITYGARAGTSAEAGSYSETVTFVCGGYY
jgi:hypothetical protein